MTQQAIRHILIAGTDLHGWTAALGLARGLQGSGINIKVLDIGQQDPAKLLSCSAHLFDFHRALGLQDAPIMQPASASLFSARHVEKADGSALWLGNDTNLPLFHGIEMHQLCKWLNAGNTGDYSLAVHAARKQRSVLPSAQKGALAGSFEPGVNLLIPAYLDFLKGAAMQLGVEEVRDGIRHIDRVRQTGLIHQVQTHGGRQLPCDLLFDNSGRTGLFIEQNLAVPYEDWTDKIPLRGMAEQITRGPTRRQPYQKLTPTTFGWTQQVTLQDMDVLHAYVVDDEAFYNQADRTFTEASFSPVRAGKRQRIMEANCVSIGAAAGFVGCPMIPELVLTQRKITRLLDHFPDRQTGEYWRHEFNRLTDLDYQALADFCSLQISLIQACATKCQWATQDYQRSQSVQQRIELFRSLGRCDAGTDGLIHRQYWLSVLDGLYQPQRGYEPLLNAIAPQQGRLFLEQIQQQIEQMVT